MMERCKLGTPRFGEERGFTVIEVVVAAAIMFMAATALLGLVATSVTLSVKAKANAIAVAAGNSVIEQVRGLAFDSVTQSSIDALAAAASGTTSGITLTVTGTVEDRWLDDQDPATQPPGYKYVEVLVSAQGPSSTPFVTRASTFVRRGMASGTPPSGETSETTLPEVPVPTVTLLTTTPTSGAVSGSPWLGMHAETGGSGVTLSYLAITAGGSLVLESTPTVTPDDLWGFWDTTTWPDGAYEMRARARDSLGQTGDVAWSLIVDNVLPDAPTNLVKTGVTANTSAAYRWNAAKDGAGENDWAMDYEMRSYRQNAGASTFSELSPQLIAPVTPEGPVNGTLSTGGFNRYFIEVRTRGARATTGVTPTWMSAPITSPAYISRPSTAGSTVTVVSAGNPGQYAKLDMTLRCDAPGFGTTGTTYYRWQYSYGGGTWTDFEITQVPQLVRNGWTAPVKGSFASEGIEIRAVVNVTPAGGSNIRIPSGITPYTSSTPGAVDWSRWIQEPVYSPAIDWSMWSL